MTKPDEGHALTEKELSALEKRIASVYGEAAEELKKAIDDYFESFVKRDEKMRSLIGTVQNGKQWTESDYQQWRLAQIGRGERFEALRDKLAERMTQANEVAVAYANDATPGIYSLNRNYTAYTIDKVTGGRFTVRDGLTISPDFILWDEQTVKRLIVKQPDLMPYYPEARAVKRGIDLAYGKKQITASVTSSILQGKSIPHIADDLQKRINTMSRESAIRTARTAVTEAQNAGRQDSYEAAAKIGIKVRKCWTATKDNRTRHDHGMADGQIVDYDQPFDVGGYKMMFPGDKSGGAPGHLIYNCRCTVETREKEGIEAEKRKMRVQTPEYTAALEAENKERERYNRVLKSLDKATSPEKRAQLEQQAEELQKSVAALEKERKKTTKTVVVDKMTFTEWQEWVKKSGNKNS